MTAVRVLKSFAGVGFRYSKGQIVSDAPDWWLEASLAEVVEKAEPENEKPNQKRPARAS